MKNINVKDSILLYAFRYALGRSSYCVSDVVEEIKNNWNNLRVNDKQIIKKEIKIAIENDDFGMDMDLKLWSSVLELE